MNLSKLKILSQRALLVTALMCVTQVSHAGDGEAGFLAPWLEVPMVARAAAMGDAFVSVQGGLQGSMYNPANISDLRKARFTSSYRVMQLDRRLLHAGVSAPLPEDATLALTWRYADYGHLAIRQSATGQELGGTLGQDEHFFTLVFAKRFSKKVSLGVGASYYNYKFDDITANSALVEIGGLFHLDQVFYDRETLPDAKITDMNLGLSIKGIGSKVPINTSDYYGTNDGVDTSYSIPIKVSVGASARAFDRQLLVATEIEEHEILGPRVKFGAEYTLRNQLALRAGLNRGDLTAGAGFIFGLGKNSLIIDYAFQAGRVEEGSEHIFTFEVGF